MYLRSSIQFLGSNPVRGIDICDRFCVELSRVGKRPCNRPIPDQELLPKCLKRVTVSEVNSDSEQAWWGNACIVDPMGTWGTSVYYVQSYLWCCNFITHKDEMSSVRHRVQTGSGTHPASYPMGTGGKAVRVSSWPLTVPRLRICGVILPSSIRLHGVVLS
jgi:hypothetical protein